MKTAAKILAGMLALLSIFLWSFMAGSQVPKRTVDAAAMPALRLVSQRSHLSAGNVYLEIFGEVENLTDQPIANLEVVGAIYDAQGTLIRTDDALVEYNPVMPHQRSPFHVMIQQNPLERDWAVTFKILGGPAVQVAN